MPRKGKPHQASQSTSTQSQPKAVNFAATARLTGQRRRSHRNTTSDTSDPGLSTQPSERQPGSEMAPPRPTETPKETVRRRILASAKTAFDAIRSKSWVVDKDMVDWHDEAIRSVITEYSKNWQESLLPFEDWNLYRFGADATLDHEKYGVHIVPCSPEFSKQITQDTPLPPWNGPGIFVTNRMKLDFETQKWVAEPTLHVGSQEEIQRASDGFWNGQHSYPPAPNNDIDPDELFSSLAHEPSGTGWDALMAEDDEDQDVT